MTTMAEIAEVAGVTQATVSNVLGNRFRAARPDAARRAKRIRQIAREMGYRPNAAARATRTGRFNMVGMLASTHGRRSIHSMGLVYGIMDELAARGLHLTLSKVPDEKLSDTGFVPRVLSELCCDGLIINYISLFPPHMRELIETHRIPSVWVNAKLDHDCVYPDDYRGTVAATDRLLSLGHERILYVRFEPGSGHYSEHDRKRGYEHTMTAAGLVPTSIGPLPPDGQDGERRGRLRELLARPDRPTALLGYSHADIYPAIIEARALGLDIPRDLSVMTFADHVYSETDYRVAVVNLDFQRMGREVGRMLVRKIEDPSVQNPAVPMELEIEEGTTLGAGPRT